MKTLDNELIGEWAESLKEIKQIYGQEELRIFSNLCKNISKKKQTYKKPKIT